MRSRRHLLFALALNGTFCLQAQYSISWSTLDGGGGTSSGGGFTVHGTVGQPDAGEPANGGSFALLGGFHAGTGSAFVPCQPDATPGGFILDPALSTVTVSGHLAGYPLQAQGPSGLTASYRGTLLASIASNGIAFPGGSVMDAQVTGNWRPLPGGNDGTAPADYGGTAVGPLGILTVHAALRNLVLDVTSSCAPLTGGQFPAATLSFNPATASPATLDALALTAGFPTPFSAPFTSPMPNTSGLPGTWQTDGTVETLTLPMLANVPLSLLNPNDSLLSFQGSFVARKTNPPPALTALLGAGPSIIVRWPHPSTGFVLQQTANMSAPGGGWTDVTQPPVLAGSNREVTLPATGYFCLFRLRYQAVVPGDTCQFAAALSPNSMLSGQTTAGLQNDFSATASCVGANCIGPDRFYQITVPAGQRLTVVVTPLSGWDPAVYFLSQCVAPVCLAGADNQGSGTVETASYLNTTGAARTVIVVVDSFAAGNSGGFTLDNTVAP